MADPTVLLLATLETKAEETQYLANCLADLGVQTRVLDISLATGGEILEGAQKLDRMRTKVDAAQQEVSAALGDGVRAVLGLGGGTGGEMALRILRSLPITFPKILVTTLPFDPRIAVADSSIILVPTLADICGLNATLRNVLETTAAMTAGICASPSKTTPLAAATSVAITGLGATEAAVASLVQKFKARGRESTVFHSNGYGGAAFARFAARGAFNAIVDLTPHEITRLHIAGAHTSMPTRFTAAADVPRILLPGAVNFIGLGEASLVPEAYLTRPHYAHSGFFTHVKLTRDEMEKIAGLLMDSLNAVPGPAALIVPMGGFSHQDCPGGAIEDPELRQVFLETAKARCDSAVRLVSLDAHISSPDVTETIVSTLDELSQEARHRVGHQ